MLKHVSRFRQKEGTNQKLGATGGLLLYLPRSKHTSDNKTPISNKIPNTHYFVKTLTKQLKVNPHNNAVLCGTAVFTPHTPVRHVVIRNQTTSFHNQNLIAQTYVKN